MTSAVIQPLTSTAGLREESGTQDLASWHYAILKLRADGTFGCPAPRGPVSQDGEPYAPTALLDAQLRRGRWAASLREAMAETGQSSPSAAVQARAVLRILAGAGGGLSEVAVPLHVAGTGELVILAALALARGDADAAEAALEPVAGLPTLADGLPVAHRLNVVFAQLGIARLRGDTVDGDDLATRARSLLAGLPVAQLDQLPGLSVMLDANVGSLLVCGGRLDEAQRVLARGAGAAADSQAARAARADCLGQLALVEAFRGELRIARRDAQLVLEPTAGSAPAGVVQAHLANALIHVERGRADAAWRSLDRVSTVGPGTHEPWVVTARLLAEARLLTLDGQPEAAVRLLAPLTAGAGRRQSTGWLDDVLAVASAEAFLACGEARRALAVLTPSPADVAVEAGVVVATALLEIGDLRGMRAALMGVGSGADRAPLGYQIRSWLLEARLAEHESDGDRVRCLIERALRVASSEGLARPLAPDSAWLRRFLDRDVSLLRSHRGLLEQLPPDPARPLRPARGSTSGGGAALVEHLTEREVQVLELLAQMFSTDEIAGDLYVSANTVKTHLKGIFRKLSVNRRVDAVRRGRELGLC